MCRICGYTDCVTSCPEEGGFDPYFGHSVGECTACEEPVYAGTRAMRRGHVLVCPDCIENVDLDAVLELAGLATARELFAELGFEE